MCVPVSPCLSVRVLVCVGGFNQTGFLSSVEVFCPDTNTWTGLSDMPFGRSGMGIAVTMEPCPGNLPEEEEEEEEEDQGGGGGGGGGGEEASKS